MSKSTVTRIFVGGMVSMIAGVVLAFAVAVAALAGGAIVIGGSSVVQVNGGPFAWTLLGLAIAAVSITGGALAGLVSWIGALLNTAELEDKTWFLLLLVLGLLSFGFIAMVAYILAGPDGARRQVTRPTVAAAPQA